MSESDFQKGRRKTFKKIENKIMQGSSDLTDRLAIALYGRNSTEVKSGGTPFMMVPIAEATREYLLSALECLSADEDIYNLVGQQEISQYKQITDGDFNAGALSAAESFRAMLATMDTRYVAEEVVGDSYKNMLTSMPKDIQYILERTGPMLIYDYLNWLNKEVIEHIALPAKIAFEGGDIEGRKPGRLKRFFGVASRNMFNPKADAYARVYADRGAQRLWPPFSEGPGSKNAPEIRSMKQKHLEKEPLITEDNSGEDFTRGYFETLNVLYDLLQDDYFDGMGDLSVYVQDIGLSPSWNSVLKPVLEDVFPALRDALQEEIKLQKAKGEGTEHDDGCVAAVSWVKNAAADLIAHSRKADMSGFDVVSTHVFDHWDSLLGEYLYQRRALRNSPSIKALRDNNSHPRPKPDL